MNIRREPTYISTDVWIALRILAKSGKFDASEIKITPDELADKLIRESLMTQYPQIFEHQKQVAKLESELLKTL